VTAPLPNSKYPDELLTFFRLNESRRMHGEPFATVEDVICEDRLRATFLELEPEDRVATYHDACFRFLHRLLGRNIATRAQFLIWMREGGTTVNGDNDPPEAFGPDRDPNETWQHQARRYEEANGP
jgi:hypothetical protein